MDALCTKVLLISANVGSIFEDPDQMFKPWLQEVLKCIETQEPGVVALHCQEVGGKNYEASMQHVNHFVKTILASEELQKYDRARVFLDEDYTAADKFTALGNLYFIHESVEDVLIFDFVDCKFLPVEGREVLSGSIENVPIKEKAKFPQHFFPEFKWSRKGFLRTRWSINNCVFDLINIHLFHDASNILAMETSPSVYSGNRQQAFLHTLQRFENDKYEKVPFFIFGDFNFRLDTRHLVQMLTAKTVQQITQGKRDQVSKIVYAEEGNGKVVLTVEAKSFDYHERHTELFYNTTKWLLQFDTEVTHFADRVSEYPIDFPPSYPFSEDICDGMSYMKTRCPSWCDRVLYGHSAKDIMLRDESYSPLYDLIGKEVCMGDHKPVFLCVHLKPGKGKDQNDSNSSDWRNSLPRLQRRKTLSINGEEVQSDMDAVNIHDYAVFEKDEALLPEFKTSIRRKSSVSSGKGGSTGSISGEGGLKVAEVNGEGRVRRKSFQQIAKEITTVERVLLHWPRALMRMRHHSSSSEDYNLEEEEGRVQNLNNNRIIVPSSKPDADVMSDTTELSQVSISISDYTPDNSPARVPQATRSQQQVMSDTDASVSFSDYTPDTTPAKVPQATRSQQQVPPRKTHPYTAQSFQEVDLHDVEPHAPSSRGTSVTPTQSVQTQRGPAPPAAPSAAPPAAPGEGTPSPQESKTSKLEGPGSCPCALL